MELSASSNLYIDTKPPESLHTSHSINKFQYLTEFHTKQQKDSSLSFITENSRDAKLYTIIKKEQKDNVVLVHLLKKDDSLTLIIVLIYHQNR